MGAEQSVAGLVVDIGGDSSLLVKSIASAAEALEGNWVKAVEGAAEIAKDLASEVADLAKEGFEFLAEHLKEATEQAASHQTAMVELEAALARAGVSGARAAAADFAQFAQGLQQTTKFEDDQIIQAAKVGASFGLTGDSLKKATLAAVDLAQVMGTDMSTAFARMSAAAETGSMRLGSGVTIHFNAAKVAIGGVSEVVAEIEQRFGGSAAAAADTFEGRVARLGHAWDDLHKSVGAAIVDNAAIKGVMEDVISVIGGAAEYVEDNKGAIETFITTGVKDYLLPGLDASIEVFKDFALALTVAKDLVVGLKDTTVATFQGIEGVVKGAAHLSLKEMADSVKHIGDVGADVGHGVSADIGKIGKAADDAHQHVADLETKINSLRNGSAEQKTKKPAPEDTAPGAELNLWELLGSTVERTKAEMEAAMENDPLKRDVAQAQVALDSFYSQLKTNMKDHPELVPPDWKTQLLVLEQQLHGAKVRQEELTKARHASAESAKHDAEIEQEALKNFADSFANTAADIITHTGNAHDQMRQLEHQMVSELIKVAIAEIMTYAATGAAATAAHDAVYLGLASLGTMAIEYAAIAAMSGNIPAFAGGGVVGGEPGTDRNLIRVSKGEEILTESDPRHVKNGGKSGATVVHHHEWHLHMLTLPRNSEAKRAVRDHLMPVIREVMALA